MRYFIMLLIALTTLSPHAHAAAKTEGDAAAIARVESYLSGISSIIADFSQVDAKGNIATGKFYLKRPGKMRWQYNPPTPVLLVSDGSVLIYFDAEMDQVNYIGIDDTLASFLARSKIELNSASTKLIDFSAKNGVIRATLVQAKKPDEGSLTLELSDKPLQIRQMTVSDATGNTTHIQLQNASYGQPLPDSLFKFEDPRGIQRRQGNR